MKCLQSLFDYFSFIVFVLFAVEVIASTTAFDSEHKTANETGDDVLSRSKRFLVFVPNGGTAKFVTGYLGPIDIPKWQNINCLRNMQFQYDLPQRWVTNPPSFPGLTRSQGRGFSGSSQPTYKPDSSRKVAYEIVQEILNR